MPLIPFGEYRPDITDFGGAHTRMLNNVLPRGDGYGPFPNIAALSDALGAQCRGFFLARNADGTVAAFAGTATELYKMSNTDFSWETVSQATYTTLSTGAHWKFAQFGLSVVAVQKNVAPQVYVLGSSTDFGDLGGSPPQAGHVSVVFRFLMLSDLNSEPRKIKWSALNDITEWTPGTDQSGEQEFADGGTVRCVAGGEYGTVLQESAIRHLTYVPNSSVIFDIDRISNDEGIYAQHSLAQAGEKVFYLSRKGFRMMLPGSLPQPIGAERVDRTFFADHSDSDLGLVIGASDPANNRVFFSYRSAGGASGLFDKLLCYDYQLNRWTTANEFAGEYMAPFAAPGVTLENMDSVNSSIDALTTTFDDISSGQLPQLAICNSSHQISLMTGDALEAEIETPEQGADGTRIRVQGFRPISDAATVYGSVAHRETVRSAFAYTPETLVNSRGLCPANISTRYSRGKIRIPAGEEWTFASGIEPEFITEGQH